MNGSCASNRRHSTIVLQCPLIVIKEGSDPSCHQATEHQPAERLLRLYRLSNHDTLRIIISRPIMKGREISWSVPALQCW